MRPAPIVVSVRDQLVPLRQEYSRIRFACDMLLLEDPLPMEVGLQLMRRTGAASTQVQQAKMWLGEAMKALGEASPYKAEEIRRQAGTSESVLKEREAENELPIGYPEGRPLLARIDWVRSYMDSVTRSFEANYLVWVGLHSELHWFVEDLLEVRRCLVRARQELGMAIAVMRDEGLVPTADDLPPMVKSERFAAPDFQVPGTQAPKPSTHLPGEEGAKRLKFGSSRS